MLRLASYPHKGDYKPNPWKPEVIQEVPVSVLIGRRGFGKTISSTYDYPYP